jgi:hypothetical protein
MEGIEKSSWCLTQKYCRRSDKDFGIGKSEQKLERKIDYISVEVCKLQDTDSFGMPSYLKTVYNFQENVACNIWKKTSRAIIALKKRRV